MYGQDLFFCLHYHKLDSEQNDTGNQHIYNQNPPPHIANLTDTFFEHFIVFRNNSNVSFNAVNFGIDHVYPGYSIQNRCNKSLTLNFVISGKGTFNGHQFHAGECYYSTPGQIHTMVADEEDPWVSIWMSVDGTLSQTIIDKLNVISTNQILPFYDSDGLQRLAHMYLYEFGHVYNTVDFMEGIVRQFTSFVIPNSNVEKNTGEIPSRLHTLINQSVSYIENNIGTVTVKELAQQAHLETKYYTRVFTTIIGCSPQEYIIKVKMELASHCLTMTDYSIEQITEILGYSHRNCFTTPFKKQFGMTPPQYRQKYGQSK